jgi:hypothetical protein
VVHFYFALLVYFTFAFDIAQVQLEGDLKIDSTNGTNITLVWNKDLKNE